MSFYVSTATFFLLHCDEWDRVVALQRHKFVTGVTLLQLSRNILSKQVKMATFNGSEAAAGNDELYLAS